MDSLKLIFDLVAGVMVVGGLMITISKFVKKFCANILIKQIDENGPECAVTDAIKLSRQNAKMIEAISKKNKETSDNIDKLTTAMDKHINIVSDNTISLKRLELMQLIQTNSADFIHISELYDEYKRQGGNSYIDVIYKKYKEQNEHYT
jgi:hypothetical protein